MTQAKTSAGKPNTPASPIPVPQVDIDEPVAVVPLASAAPIEGPPDGERINTFALAPATRGPSFADLGADTRHHVRANPLTSLAVAFSLGYLLARVLR